MVTNDDYDLSDVVLSVIGCLVIEVSKSNAYSIFNGFLKKANKVCVAIIKEKGSYMVGATPQKV